MNTQSIIRHTRKEIVKEEFGYLRQDWEPLKNCFIATFTISPFAIFGMVIFCPAIILASLFALVRITLKF